MTYSVITITLLFLLALSGIHAEAEETCAPLPVPKELLLNCTGQDPCPYDGVFCVIGKPRQYYVCGFGERVMEKECPCDLHFNFATKTCDLLSRGHVGLCPCPFNLPTPELDKLATETALPVDPISVCYYPNWSQYRWGVSTMKMEFMRENAGKCTHVIAAFMSVKNLFIDTTEWNDEKFLRDLVGLKLLNPEIKISIAIGGWNANMSEFNYVMKSEENLYIFTTNTLDFLKKHKLDGLDLDVEYPTERGSPPEGREQFTELVKTLRRRFAEDAIKTGNDRFLLTAAVGPTNVTSRYQPEIISVYLDYIHLMTYDLYGPWNSFVGHNAPLYSTNRLPQAFRNFNVASVVDEWLAAGVPRQKLVLGVPFYARSLRLAKEHPHGIGAPITSAGKEGPWTNLPGTIAYFEACLLARCGNYRRYNDKTQSVEYMVEKNGLNWVGWDHADTITAKVEYALNEKLAGVMIWDISFDDMVDVCHTGVKFPLLTTVKAVLDGKPRPEISLSRNTSLPECGRVN